MLTGFGFLAFGLKKLMLPLMFVAHIVKSMLFALFLPSIIGSVGKILEKGDRLIQKISMTVILPGSVKKKN